MGERKTVQKRLIDESLSRLYHPTAEEIYQDVIATLPDVSRTTIYRNLNQMVEDNRINALQFDKGATRYEKIKHDHSHFYCRKCGRIFDLPLLEVDLQPAQELIKGCEIEEVEVLLSGICQDCKIDN